MIIADKDMYGHDNNTEVWKEIWKMNDGTHNGKKKEIKDKNGKTPMFDKDGNFEMNEFHAN